MRGDETTDPPDVLTATRRIYSRWLADLSLALDDYMRSPAFLHWMTYGLRAMNETRRFHRHGLKSSLDERD